MMDYVYNGVLLYGLELLKLMLFCFGIMGVKMIPLKKSIPVCSISVIIAAIAGRFLNEQSAEFLYGIMAVAVSVLVSTEKKKAPVIVVEYIYICILDMIIYGMISSVMTIELESAIVNKPVNTMLNALSLSVIIPLTMYSAKKKRVLQEGLSVVNVILLSMGGVTLAFSLTIFLFLFGNDISTKYARIALTCMCVIGLVFLICTQVIISGKMQNRLLKRENNYVRHIMKAQETYYEMLLQRDEETRKFRHDFQNHLNCLSMLYQEKKWDDFESYLKSLDGALREIRNVVETGNKIVNTIISDIISKHPEVKYTWKGCLPSEFNITPMQLCTIFSNIICNAFEAAEKVENGDVYIEVRNIGTSVRVLITNASVSVPKIENGKYISSKKEENHGFGIGNVIKVLDSLNGAFRIEPVDGRINVEIIIPGAFDLN